MTWLFMKNLTKSLEDRLAKRPVESCRQHSIQTKYFMETLRQMPCMQLSHRFFILTNETMDPNDMSRGQGAY